MAVSIASIAAILFIATASRLAIESRSALPATIRSAARHDHGFSLGSMPGLSVPSDLRADAFASIACANLTIATANRLAIESRPAPTVPIPFLTPHIDYKTAERAVNLTQTHPIIVHATDNASIAGVSIFIATALAVESHAVTTTITPVRASVPPDSDTNHNLGSYRTRPIAAGATTDQRAHVATTDATTIALAIESRAVYTDPKPIRAPATSASDLNHDHGPYKPRAVTTAPMSATANSTLSVASATAVVAAADALAIELSPVTRVIDRAPIHGPYQSRTITTAPTSATANSILSVASATAVIAAAGALAIESSPVTRVIDRAPIATSAPSTPFASKHSTSITICRALTSIADADGPADGTPGDHRAYHCMDMKNSPKYKKAKKTIPESPTPGSHTDSATADSATATAISAADADSVTDADFAVANESAASRGLKRASSNLPPEQTRRQRARVRAAVNRAKRDISDSSATTASAATADTTAAAGSVAVNGSTATDAPGPVVTRLASARYSDGVVRGFASTVNADSAAADFAAAAVSTDASDAVAAASSAAASVSAAIASSITVADFATAADSEADVDADDDSAASSVAVADVAAAASSADVRSLVVATDSATADFAAAAVSTDASDAAAAASPAAASISAAVASSITVADFATAADSEADVDADDDSAASSVAVADVAAAASSADARSLVVATDSAAVAPATSAAPAATGAAADADA